MKKILKNKFQIIKYKKSLDLMDFAWLPNISKKLNDKKYIEEVKIGAQYISIFHPVKILVQVNNLEYPISPDVQEKVNKIIYKSYEIAKTKKLAFLVSNDIFNQLSMEQTVSISERKNVFKTKYFKSYKNAFNWLIE